MLGLRKIWSFLNSIYLTNKLFVLFAGIILLFLLSFGFKWLFPIAQTGLTLGALLLFADLFLLFNKGFGLSGSRHVQKTLSLGDENKVRLTIANRAPMQLTVMVIDELPAQLQKRDFNIVVTVPPNEQVELEYMIRPLIRGSYAFGRLNLYARSFLGLFERRNTIAIEEEVAVYPSVMQMRKFELKTFTRIADQAGIKRTRRIGHSYEFEQIRNYVIGDDYRSINWKATGRKGDLMVNQYEDERAQQVYCIIDKSRAMKMPFDGLSLLDHSINTSLVISNIALRKYDKAGLLTFSDKIGTLVKAERGPGQLNRIMEGLYKQKERNLEANYELLYTGIRRMVKGRGLIFLYTNFESPYSMERVLPLLRRINSLHLLVVVFFENTELTKLGAVQAKNIQEIYLNTIAQKLAIEKQQIVQELNRYGIQSILTKPNELSMNTINKYLELKSRGLI